MPTARASSYFDDNLAYLWPGHHATKNAVTVQKTHSMCENEGVPSAFVDDQPTAFDKFAVLAPVSGNGALASSQPWRMRVGRSSLPRSARVSAADIVRRQASATGRGMLSIIDLIQTRVSRIVPEAKNAALVFGNPLREILSDCLVLRLDNRGRKLRQYSG